MKKLNNTNKIAKKDNMFLFFSTKLNLLWIIKYTKEPIKNSYNLNGSKKKLIFLSLKIIAINKEEKKNKKNNRIVILVSLDFSNFHKNKQNKEKRK